MRIEGQTESSLAEMLEGGAVALMTVSLEPKEAKEVMEVKGVKGGCLGGHSGWQSGGGAWERS